MFKKKKKKRNLDDFQNLPPKDIALVSPKVNKALLSITLQHHVKKRYTLKKLYFKTDIVLQQLIIE